MKTHSVEHRVVISYYSEYERMNWIDAKLKDCLLMLFFTFFSYTRPTANGQDFDSILMSSTPLILFWSGPNNLKFFRKILLWTLGP